MNRCIRNTLSGRSVRAVAVLLGCILSAGRCDEVADGGGPRYYRRVQPGEPSVIECDVAAYGGTPGGVAAAIQAARMGKKAVLLSFNRHVGGMTSGGLTATDIGNRAAVGGLALEFYSRIGKMRDYRPSEAESLYLKMLDEAGVQVLFGRCLQSGEMRDGRLVSVRMETGETIKAAMFVDATYEGDLLAVANVSHHVGREPAGAYGESLGGQWQNVAWSNVYQFCSLPVSPYVDPNDPNSGLLPEISLEAPGKRGEGDFKVQAYNFRMHLTDKEGKIAFPRPRGYDPGRYALLARFLEYDPQIRWTLHYTTAPMTDGPVQMRNGDSNNAGSFSSDYVGGSYRWPDGTYEPSSFVKLPAPRRGLPMPLSELYELRERIFQDHVNYQQGLMYFLATDPRVPEALQKRVNRFGLDPNEFQETGYWPHQLYVREGRRMVSEYVMTQANCEWKTTVSDSVGLASYAMDSHFCQRVIVEEDGKMTVRNEGGFGHGCRGPYPVSYRSIVPKREECANLFVPVCLSASHVAYGSIRMEPVFMILGQSAGTAAAMAIDDGVAVQEVSYDKLQRRLLEDGQLLKYDAPAASPDAVAAAGWELAWSDEFESDKLNDTKWSRCERGTPDWKNTMSDDPRLLKMEDGVLHLWGVVNDKKGRDPAPFLTAGITSKGKYAFRYGKVQIRARFQSAQGAWPALWMLGAEKGWPANGEIDLMEHLNFDRKIYQTVHSEYTVKIDKTNTPKKNGTAPIDRNGWNTYGCEWDADKIVFTVNGQPTHTYPRVPEKGEKQWPFHQPFYFILSMQIGGKWVNSSGPSNPAHYPAGMEVDWVRVYRRTKASDESSIKVLPAR